MIKPRVALIFVLLTAQSAKAEILADEDIESIEAPPARVAGASEHECGFAASVGVALGRGTIEFPYGPPGLNNYKSQAGGSGLSLNLKKSKCAGRGPDHFGAKAGITNYFPSGGRIYEVQAVSWSEIKISANAEQDLFQSGGQLLSGVVEGTLMYDRFNYATGTYASQYFLISGGLRHSVFTRLFDHPVLLGLDVSAAPVLLSRIMTKYDSAKTSPSADSTLVSLNPDRRLTGTDFSLGSRFAFSSELNEGSAQGFNQLQHEIELLWVSKNRFSSNFILEKESGGKLVSERDLKTKSATWILRWSERI
ncbi:MAG: hypothetical protein EBR09_00595 [Proteobacteria bacterium]|nr:hypothetical protein [Pseudomonadota bacterium]